MNQITRRSFLSAMAGAVGAIAACNQITRDPSIDPPATIPSTPASTSPSTRPTTFPSSRPTTRRGRGFGGGANQLKVRPVEFKGDLLNPHIGTETFQRFNGDPLYPDNFWDDTHGPVKFDPPPASLKNDHYPDTTVAYCRWVWSLFEPVQGQYNWDAIEGSLKSARERGQTLHVRLQPYTGRQGPMPAWYWDLSAARSGRNDYPDHNDPLYIQHFGNLIREFGKKFDGHPSLEAFDIAYGGPFGEMGGNASAETSQKLTDIYIQALPKTQLIAMMGTTGTDYAIKNQRPIGWRFDCFGDSRQRNGQPGPPAGLGYNEMYDEYPRQTEPAQAVERWKLGPVVLETCGTVGTWFNDHGDIDFIIDQGWQYHASLFMPKSCKIPDAWTDKIAAFNRRLGYRFVLRQLDILSPAPAGKPAPTNFWIENVGVAPIYRPYKLALRFTQGQTIKIAHFKEDIRKWLPGNHYFEELLTLPSDLARGPAQIDLAIVDEDDNPKVKLAIEGIGKDGWHTMGTIAIS